MHIDKYLNEDGHYVDENGCWYETTQDFLTGMINFCSCGDPDAALQYIKTALNQVRKLKDEVWKDILDYNDWDKENEELLGGERGVYFMWYYLDAEQFTEHGTSVPGWLTQKGIKFLEDLNEYFENEIKC